MRRFIIPLFVFSLFVFSSSAQVSQPSFRVVPLGTEGGLNESNLSAYLVAPQGSENFVCLDAGTVYSGVKKAIDNGVFSSTIVDVIRQHIKGYCISHPHLDHVAGLIINSPADTNKTIYGSSFCLERIAKHDFSWDTWANFGDAGEQPMLKKYHYQTVSEDSEISISQTNMFVKAFPLSHAKPFESTAFLVRKDSSYLLYFGDTGADSVEGTHHLQNIWQTIAPLMQRKQIKGIFIEVSYPDNQPLKQLFGHLTPRLLMKEMETLASVCGRNNLKNLPLIITHMKPEGNNELLIKKEIAARNSLKFHLIFPQQGTAFGL